MQREIYRKLGRLAPAITIATIGILLCGSARAAELEAYRKLWRDPAIVQRIQDNIEKHRKGDATIEIVGQDGRPVAAARLEVRQQSHAFLFGCNAFVLGQFDTPAKNRKYEEAFLRLFNFATVPFYWEGTEPTQGELRYAEGSRDIWRRPPADRYPPWAKAHGVTLKGHPLLWHAYNPPWLPHDAAELKRLYQKRFDEISSRYASAIKIFDVVNESIVCSKKYPLYTPDLAYVEWAFRQAAPRFRPDNVLMINEVTEVSHEPGENRYYQQVAGMIGRGVRVNGIGFQFHLFSDKRYNGLVQGVEFAPKLLGDVYDKFAELNCPLFITEITVPQKAAGPEGEALQAELTANLYRLWFSAPRMAGITWWNLGDGTAVKGENKFRGGLADDKLDPKAAYRALDKLINGEWKTQTSAQTGSDGRACFRGFYGKYLVKVAAGGRTREFQIDLSREGRSPYKLVWKP